MSLAYYNEIDANAASWLRELIAQGLIAKGEVDERSIEEVSPDDIRGFTQCHFFAGIGVWSYALRLAGWPDDRPVWTGSCPCQPFSVAGKRKAQADARHLWPEWYRLIRELRPDVVFGEQVASKDGIAWLDTVSAQLEREGYAVGATVLPACSVGAPHRRDRLWIVADAHGGHASAEWEQRSGQQRQLAPNGSACDVANDARNGWLERRPESSGRSALGGCELGDTGEQRAWRDTGAIPQAQRETRVRPIGDGLITPGPVNGFWADAEWIYCRDEKWRPIKPGTFPLAHGVTKRVAKLRGAGNAIVAQAAAEMIGAYLEASA